MSSNAQKIIGTTIVFNSYTIGEVTDIGRATMTRNEKKIVTTDSDDDDADFLSQDIERGTLSLTVVYDGSVGDAWSQLESDFAASTEANLVVTYRNGSIKTVLAKVINLDTAGGAADGGHAEFGVTFRLLGRVTKTAA
jgi:hypothetical protein